MSQTTINLPILVQQLEIEGRSQYYLRPLFLGYPIATHLRFERAISKLQTEIKRTLRGTEIGWENVNDFLWFKFNPEYTFKTYTLQISTGKQFVKGDFSAAHFDLKGIRFVCLPSFGNYMFMASPDERGKYKMADEVEQGIRKYIKNVKNNGGVFDANDHTATKGEFITEIDCTLRVEYTGFPFENDPLDFFFSGMRNNEDFKGGVEIAKVGYNLNAAYPAELQRAYCRDELVKRLSQIIYQEENTPIVLVGREGVGKHTLIHEVVWQYISNHTPKNPEHLSSIWHIDPTRIIAGMSVVGQWQKRFEAILQFVVQSKNKQRHAHKVMIDNVVAMLRIGKSSQNDMTLSDVLKPYLEKRLLQLIIVSTPEEWKVLQDKDRRFADLFQVIRIHEPNEDVAAKMVSRQRINLELEHSCTITTLALAQLFSLHRNYMQQEALPGSVMKMLHQLAVRYKFSEVDVPQVRETFEEQSGMQWEIFDETYTFDKNEVQDSISAHLIGQPEAVKCLSETIHLIKAKLNPPGKPLSSFLFIGPTGVGKTQGAKVLCKYLMGSEDHLIRFDMNEYIDQYAVQRLIGDANQPEGQLTGKVRYQPFGILLLDEIEKAHPSVHDLLLQVLDDGRLTDSRGRTTSFNNIIIIMTSNVGARDVASIVGFDTKSRDEGAVYRQAVEKHFRPEFINRIDRIVIFDPLELEHIQNIAKLQIKELLSRDGFVRRTTILNIAPEALDWVARRGFDDRMGGRALKRQIEKDLTTLSADQLIGMYSDGPIIFNIDFEDGHLVPGITPLNFVAPLPDDWLLQPPTTQKFKGVYKKLKSRLDTLRQDIAHHEDEQDNALVSVDDNNWQRFHYKNQIEELREDLDKQILGYGHDIYEESPVKSLRVKRAGISSIVARPDAYDAKERRQLKDQFFQKDAIEQLRDSFYYGEAHFDRMQTRYLNDLIAVEMLELAADGFMDNRSDHIEITVQSAVASVGDAEVKFLLDLYARVFGALDIKYQYNKGSQQITAEGYGLYRLFEHEAGIHLFHRPHSNPLPVQLMLRHQNSQQIKPSPPLVIRIYDQLKLITDIRTGFSNSTDISVWEFRLFLYGGLV